jgi:predicted Zn-dependent protease
MSNYRDYATSTHTAGKQPKHNGQGIKTKALRQIFGSTYSTKQMNGLFVVIIALFSTVWYTTPLSTTLSALVVNSIVPRYLDVQMGASALSSTRYVISHDGSSQARVGRIGRDLLATLPQIDTRDFKFTFQVIDEPVINAYAYPGGAIFITQGLLQTLQATDSEVAAVLSHEIGHVVSRHSVSRLLSDNFIRILWLAAIYEDDDDYKENFGEAIGETLVKYALYLGTMSYSRANEYEADNYGWNLVQRSTYNSQGMISFFEKLINAGGDHSQWWMSTHPHTEERVKALLAK